MAWWWYREGPGEIAWWLEEDGRDVTGPTKILEITTGLSDPKTNPKMFIVMIYKRNITIAM